MAMNGTQLGDEIAAAITDSGASADAQAAVKAIWEKIGTCIVNHIVTNAEVPAGIAVATTGTEKAQTGATTAPGAVL